MKAPKTKTAKSEPPVPTFPPDEWVPLNPDAFARIMASVGDPTLAARRFHQDALAGRLETGLVEIPPDGEVVERLLTRSDWKRWTVRWKQDFTPTGVAIILANVIDKDNKVMGGYFFVRRAKLDKRYPRELPAAAQSDYARPTTSSEPRRRPGPKPDYPRWRLEAAAFTHEFLGKEKRMPSAKEVAGHLQTKYGWEPHQTDVRELLRFLLRE